MKELGTINREISRVISHQGHGDLLMVVDAGFPIPSNLDVIDISLGENNPMVVDILDEMNKFFSVEKMILANQTRSTNPSFFKKITASFGNNVEIETIDHQELKEMSKQVKAIIRSGDFTAYGNVILVSGAGNRWYSEKNQG